MTRGHRVGLIGDGDQHEAWDSAASARRQDTPDLDVSTGSGREPDQATRTLAMRTLASVPCWRYTQLTITVDGRVSQLGKRTIRRHGPGQGLDENHAHSDQTVLEATNPFGADSWELAGQDYREEGNGPPVGRRPVYTFKRRWPVPRQRMITLTRGSKPQQCQPPRAKLQSTPNHLWG